MENWHPGASQKDWTYMCTSLLWLSRSTILTNILSQSGHGTVRCSLLTWDINSVLVGKLAEQCTQPNWRFSALIAWVAVLELVLAAALLVVGCGFCCGAGGSFFP